MRSPQGNVLRIPAFRRMWLALGLASFGDWLGLLAFTALAYELAPGGYAAQGAAVSSVLLIRLLPAMILGPFAGVVADRLDRRWTMVAANSARAAILVWVPFVEELKWLFLATFLLEVASMFFIPAKEATIPNLVPRSRLEAANSVNLLTTYGAAPIAAGLFALLSAAKGLLGAVGPAAVSDPIVIALWLNAAAFLASALLIVPLREISSQSAAPRAQTASKGVVGATVGVLRDLVDGWRFIAATPLVRGLVVGMLGAFAAGGVVIALAKIHVQDLGAGNSGYGLLFATVFVGLAAGMGLGPRLLGGFSRRRLFGLAITSAGISLTLLALIPNMVLVVLLTFVVGAFAGVAWVTGYTLLGLEVDDELRGRTFAFVQMMVRIVLGVVIAFGPRIAGALGQGYELSFGDAEVTYSGAAITLLLGGLVAAALGVVATVKMDDRPGISLRADLLGSRTADARLGSSATRPAPTGFFIAFEGGEGTGKSTQSQRLAEELRRRGSDVVVTREPGATAVGAHLRRLLLDDADAQGISSRAEALLYAADRAEHVDKVIRPALERGAVVITDRYVDSSMAYQGAGRVLDPADVRRLSAWATGGLRPHLTVVLDLPAVTGLGRAGAAPDRLESEPLEFHERVRAAFLAQARSGQGRYAVIDASGDVEDVARQVLRKVDDAWSESQDGAGGAEPAAPPIAAADGEGAGIHDGMLQGSGAPARSHLPVFSAIGDDGRPVRVNGDSATTSSATAPGAPAGTHPAGTLLPDDTLLDLRRPDTAGVRGHGNLPPEGSSPA